MSRLFLVVVACVALLLVPLIAGLTMSLVFFGFLAAIVLVAWIVSKITGARTTYLDEWKFNDGETVVWRDDRADVITIASIGRAAVTRPLRLHGSSVVVTNQRVIVANMTLFSKRRIVTYVLYPGTAPDEQSKRLDGGLLTRGFTTYAIQPDAMALHAKERFHPSYVALKPVANVGPSLNVAEIRVYTDSFESFRLPGT